MQQAFPDFKLAERRPFRECRKNTAKYKDYSSESEEDPFLDADSSLNQTLENEDNSIAGQKELIKNRKLTSDLVKGLAGCRLDGSTIVFDDDIEDEEVVETGVVVGTAPPSKLGREPERINRPIMVNFEDENGVDEAGALREAIKNLERLQ